MQGQSINHGLSHKGEEEALSLANKLKEFKVDKIICSDLERALQTSEIINRIFTTSLISDKRLRECSFGDLEGLTLDEVGMKYGEEALSNWKTWDKTYDFKKYGGENRDEVLSRHLQAIKEYAEKERGGLLLMIGHGGGMNTLLSGLGYEMGIEQGGYRLIDYPKQ